MATEGLRIKMLKTVCVDYFFGAVTKTPVDTFLLEGHEYAATANCNAAIAGICDNGQILGVKPGEFEFIEAPEWVLAIWQEQGFL